jgi:hypothetical protein
MAVGYHKLNTSGARNRNKKTEHQSAKPVVVKKGYRFFDAMYGAGITEDDFVSDVDEILCRFDSGMTVKLQGRAIRAGNPL